MSKLLRSPASPHSKFLLRGSVVLAVAAGGLISISIGGPTLKQRQDTDRQAIAKKSAAQSLVIQAARVRESLDLDSKEADIVRNVERQLQFGPEAGIYPLKRHETETASECSKASEPYISVYDADGKFSYGIYLLRDKNKAEQSAVAINR